MGEQDLAQAFHALFDFVAAVPVACAKDADAPIFTYLLTPKQLADLEIECQTNGWPSITCPGILIDAEAVRHPLRTRTSKDGITEAEIRTIVIKAYSQSSMVRSNRGRDKQAIVLNANQKVQVGATTFYAMAIVQIEVSGDRCYLAPVTAYHANEAKARAIKNR